MLGPECKPPERKKGIQKNLVSNARLNQIWHWINIFSEYLKHNPGCSELVQQNNARKEIYNWHQIFCEQNKAQEHKYFPFTFGASCPKKKTNEKIKAHQKHTRHSSVDFSATFIEALKRNKCRTKEATTPFANTSILFHRKTGLSNLGTCIHQSKCCLHLTFWLFHSSVLTFPRIIEDQHKVELPLACSLTK